MTRPHDVLLSSLEKDLSTHESTCWLHRGRQPPRAGATPRPFLTLLGLASEPSFLSLLSSLSVSLSRSSTSFTSAIMSASSMSSVTTRAFTPGVPSAAPPEVGLLGLRFSFRVSPALVVAPATRLLRGSELGVVPLLPGGARAPLPPPPPPPVVVVVVRRLLTVWNMM